MNRPDWVSGDVDVNAPSSARVYDFYLGGHHNLPVDRMLAEQAIALWPVLPRIMQTNRAFMRRAVRYLIHQGITQFLDIGSGIPTVGNVHEVVQRYAPQGTVVYVDVDPVAVAHSRAILAGDPRTDVVQADLRDVAAVLDRAQASGLLDLSRPVGVLMVAVLHFVPDEDQPARILARYRDALASGSHLVISHASNENRPEKADEHADLYRRSGQVMAMRSRAGVTQLLDGFTLVPPGTVFLTRWRPDPGTDGQQDPELMAGIAAVGRLP